MPQRLEQPDPLSLLEIHFLLCLTDTQPVAGVSCAEHIPALQKYYMLGNWQRRNECCMKQTSRVLVYQIT